jgi:NAD(P)-dependent dehydrogenase (short-subunit alcohol dehydrogenase family)
VSKLLDGKVAVITGGVTGMGLATAETFVREGAKVVIGDIQDEAGQKVVDGLGDNALYHHADVTSEDDVEGLIAAAVEKFGRIDTLFSNAGLAGDVSAITDLGREGLEKTLALNLNAHVFAFKHAGRQLKKQGDGGSLIVTSSTAAIESGWAGPTYGIGKAGVLALSRAAAFELGGFGIRSNAIVPGLILTPIHAKLAQLDESAEGRYLELLEEKFSSIQTLQRVGYPQDVANVALFLASDLSAFVSGVTLPVDGGALSTSQIPFATGAGEAREAALRG